nr:MAG TPA: hypothetical protein [Caudoviricetes sp.]
MSLGSITCRATSDSFLRSGLTLDLAWIERFILYLRRGRRIGPAVLGFKTLNLTTHLKQPPSQRRQITRRRTLVKHRNFKAMQCAFQQFKIGMLLAHLCSPLRRSLRQVELSHEHEKARIL